MDRTEKHINLITIIRISFLMLLFSVLSLFKANAQEFGINTAQSVQSYRLNKDSFRFHLCKKTQNDSGIIGTILIDKGRDGATVEKNDTIKENNLLKGDTIILKCNHKYNLIFIGKNKWNHLTYFTGKCNVLVRVKDGVSMASPVFDCSSVFCYDRLKNKHHVHKRQSDFYITSDGFNFIGGFSEPIKKGRKR